VKLYALKTRPGSLPGFHQKREKRGEGGNKSLKFAILKVIILCVEF
jgi:hypothetical protein